MCHNPDIVHNLFLGRETFEGALAAPAERVRLQVAGLGDDSIAVGADELGLAPLLEDPLGTLLEPDAPLRVQA